MPNDFVARTSPIRVLLIVAACLIFVVIGIWMGGVFGKASEASDWPAIKILVVGWICVTFSGCCAIAWASKLFGDTEQVRIGTDGIRSLGYSDKTIPWSQIVSVSTRCVGFRRYIALRLRDPSRFPPQGLARITSLNDRLVGGGHIYLTLMHTDRSFNEAMKAILKFHGCGH